ncbi:hypothetical protein PENFLA_c022G06123 [Penicillium flavigenum]|uniref:Uncharacterized protein n=1 Tax=Penicillium flavigenum TaxID=254877 RepID=A0A1V6SVN2_9EURO|nr:hypothetical protein PENFLA_c022G06123 [Penicillium flavigenum]
MTSSSLVSHDDYGVQQILDQWGDTSQYAPTLGFAPTPGYAPTPGNLRWSPTSPSDIGSTNVDPISPVDYSSPQQTASQKNSLPLLQFGDWEEGRTYDKDPPLDLARPQSGAADPCVNLSRRARVVVSTDHLDSAHKVALGGQATWSLARILTGGGNGNIIRLRSDVEPLIKGYPGNKHRSFPTLDDAVKHLAENGVPEDQRVVVTPTDALQGQARQGENSS